MSSRPTAKTSSLCMEPFVKPSITKAQQLLSPKGQWLPRYQVSKAAVMLTTRLKCMSLVRLKIDSVVNLPSHISKSVIPSVPPFSKPSNPRPALFHSPVVPKTRELAAFNLGRRWLQCWTRLARKKIWKGLSSLTRTLKARPDSALSIRSIPSESASHNNF